jgi:WD repeat-containing protein 45
MAISTAPGSTLLTIPGRQPGHVHVIHLTPCPSPATPSSSSMQFPPPLPSPAPALTPPKSTIIITHESALSSLTCPPSGTLFATSSERGTLVRVWDSRSGALVRELRRGADRAVIWGVGWRKDGRRLAVWSDKGTVHVFSLEARGSGGSGGGNAAEDADKSVFQLLPFSV